MSAFQWYVIVQIAWTGLYLGYLAVLKRRKRGLSWRCTFFWHPWRYRTIGPRPAIFQQTCPDCPARRSHTFVP